MRQFLSLWPALLLTLLMPFCADAQTAQEVTLPSAFLTGNKAVDTISVRLYRPQKADAATVTPAVIVLPPIGSDNNTPRMRRIAGFLSENGVTTAVLTLPYHGKRKGDVSTLGAYVGYDADKNADSFQQAASDVSTVLTWLQTQPGVDKNKIGVAGFSLGAIITHLAMGQDERISAGVAIVGSGDLADLYERSALSRLYRLTHRPPVNFRPTPFRSLSPADPLTFAGKNRPRRVLMVQAARDFVILPSDANELWEALGRPPLRWIDTNHVGSGLGEKSLARAALFYVKGVWDGKTDAELNATLPPISAPLFKGGFLAQFGDRSQLGLTPAVSWQFASLGRAHTHTSLFYAETGLTGRGPFIGAGITANAFLDIGFASRFSGKFAPLRPYLGLHFSY